MKNKGNCTMKQNYLDFISNKYNAEIYQIVYYLFHRKRQFNRMGFIVMKTAY